ncbi:MAG: PKD domain-containing protein [Myxococcota bacterium]
MKHAIAGASALMSFWVLLAGGCSTGLRVSNDVGTIPEDTGDGLVDVPPNFDPGGPGPNPGGNQAPVADAGDDFTAVVSNEVFLDGSDSFDPNGDPLTYTWVLQQSPPGSVSFLINDTRVESSLFLDRPGTYLVELAVSDGFESSRDSIEILAEVLNAGPVAVAGRDQNVSLGETVVLSGGDSYDPDGQPITFQWDLVTVPPASAASLSNASASVTTFVADRSGTYEVELVVSDGSDASLPDTVVILASEGGGSGGSGCVSCSSAPNLTGGGIASGAGLLGLPLFLLWWWRRDP